MNRSWKIRKNQSHPTVYKAIQNMQIKVTRIRKSSFWRGVEKQILGRGVVDFVLTGQNASFFYLFILKNGSFVILLSFHSSLYILDNSSLSKIPLAVFSPSLWLIIFILLILSYTGQKVLFLMKSCLLILFVFVCVLCFRPSM